MGVLDKEVENARKSAQTQNIPVGMFSPVEPYNDFVDGAVLLDEIARIIRKYIICDPETVTAATLWIAFTWFIDRVQVAPIAMITAPEMQCGKTQLLTLIAKLVYRALMASNISPAAIFRVIEAHGPTLLIDEADSFLKENEEARGIINSGHTRQGLWLVGDHGVYLMPNTSDGIHHSKLGKDDRRLVVYARECNPDQMEFDDWWENKRRSFGGDDGVEFLNLKEIEELAAHGSVDGHRPDSLAIAFGPNQFELSVVFKVRNKRQANA